MTLVIASQVNHEMKPPGKHLLKHLHAFPVFADLDHAPVEVLGGSDGDPACPRQPVKLAMPPSWLEKCLLIARTSMIRRWHRLHPLAHARHDLHAFSLGMAQWLIAVHDLDTQNKHSVQAADNALIALVMRIEDGPLAYCADFNSLYACHLGHQWKKLGTAAQQRICLHAGWLLAGSEDGLIPSLTPRIEHRRVGFGWYEDYFRHMSRAQYAQFLRGCQILADHGPAALQMLMQPR